MLRQIPFLEKELLEDMLEPGINTFLEPGILLRSDLYNISSGSAAIFERVLTPNRHSKSEYEDGTNQDIS